MNELAKSFIATSILAVGAGVFACLDLRPLFIVFAALSLAMFLLGPLIFSNRE